MSSIAARRANKRACPLQPNGILSRGTHGILAQMPCRLVPAPGVGPHAQRRTPWRAHRQGVQGVPEAPRATGSYPSALPALGAAGMPGAG